MNTARAILRTLVRQHGWEDIQEMLDAEKPEVEREQRRYRALAERARAAVSGPVSDLDQARAKKILRKLNGV